MRLAIPDSSPARPPAAGAKLLTPLRGLPTVLPGLGLVCAVGAAAYATQRAEARVLAGVPVDALVIAIVLGAGVRTLWAPTARWAPGIAFAGKQLLEVAVVLLGATVSLPLLLAGGRLLLAGIVATVAVALAAGALAGRAVGLEPTHALLVAAGNAICGNSAIAALAPVIGARRDQVASTVAFTALLSVLVTIALPLLVPLLGLTDYQYGVVAGMSVYAVPQVLAAAFPVSAASGEVATLVKLIRVLLLGPVLLVCAVSARRRGRRPRDGGSHTGPQARGRAAGARRFASQVVPWFVVGFLALAVLRSARAIPDAAAALLRPVSHWLTVLAMAALGLGVELRAVRRGGGRVVTAALLSLLVLVTASTLLARAL